MKNKAAGFVAKMQSQDQSPIQYALPLSKVSLPLNPLIGKKICLDFSGKMACIHCGRAIKKTFSQGFCFPCHQRLGECDFCNIHPERCRVEEGTCDPTDWAHARCTQPHIIYLANASGLKVGVTRDNQIPTRWIDQGAIQALPIFTTSNRKRAGEIEVALKAFVADKTNWRVMLKGAPPVIDLAAERHRLIKTAARELTQVMQRSDVPIRHCIDVRSRVFDYPVTRYLEKINSLSFDKTPRITGTLLGIKGQYLILDAGVLNIRKFGGYHLEVSSS